MREKCAVVGVFDPEMATELAASAIRVLDHRGPHATGIGGISGDNEMVAFHAPGRAREVLTEPEVAKMSARGLTVAIAHGRYATSGGMDKAHPIKVNTGRQAILYEENGTNSDLRPLEADLAQRGYNTDGLIDSEMNALAIGDRIKRGASAVEAIAGAYRHMIGGQAGIIACHDLDGSPMLAAYRDPCGIRPLAWGRTPGKGYMFASETIGLDEAGATIGGEVPPGGLMTVSHNGLKHYQLAPPNPKFDPFELLYFSNKRSLFKGQPIGDIRAALGRRLAEEYGFDSSSNGVIGIPNTAITFAAGYAAATDIEHRQEILRKNSTARAFLGNTAKDRQNIRNGLYTLQDHLVKGGEFDLVDDSLLRNGNAPFVNRLFREAGAAAVRLYIGSPPIRYPNFYGTNIPHQRELVASHQSAEQIRRDTGVDSLGYLSLEGMLETFYDMTGESDSNFDLSCFTGDYRHTSIGPRDIYEPIYADYSA
ncbi:MAG TPA: hypothetical protein VLF59_00735 [Candidatus Saccharimonadales bacterium]|nr:hypothetical protein [Candidatus Saccharimonadales bacterium]